MSAESPRAREEGFIGHAHPCGIGGSGGNGAPGSLRTPNGPPWAAEVGPATYATDTGGGDDDGDDDGCERPAHATTTPATANASATQTPPRMLPFMPTSGA